MLVARIANTRFYQPQISTQHSQKRYKKVSFCGDCFVASFEGPKKNIDSVHPLEQEMQRFGQDILYRKQLLENAGLSTVNYKSIRSIIGPSEIKAIIEDYDGHGEYYCAGENGANIPNIRANLHIHTQASDGFFDIQTLLDDAAAHADKVMNKHRKPFIIAITDHDTVRGTRKAIEIIAKNPEKYKNLRVILGIEFTAYDNILPKVLNKPTNIDVLAYGIDPNEGKLVEFIRRTKKYKQRIAVKMIEKANEFYKNAFGTEEKPFNLEQAQRLYTPVKEGILETHRFVESYIEITFLLKEVILKHQELRQKLKQQNPNLDDNKLVDKLINEIAVFYKPIDNNTKKYGGEKTLCTFLSEKLSVDKSKIAQIIAENSNSDKVQNFVENLESMFKRYKTVLIASHKEIPDMRDVRNALKGQQRVVLGIAHPLKYLKKIDEAHLDTFLKDLYDKFKMACGKQGFFSEFYYQSYVDGPKEISKKPTIRRLLEALSNQYHLLKTGGFDCHDAYLFARRFKK